MQLTKWLANFWVRPSKLHRSFAAYSALVSCEVVMETIEARALLSASMIADLTPGGDSKIYESADVGGTFVFTLNTPATGTELWRSDGTVAGTSLLKDIVPGKESSSPAEFTAIGKTLYFFPNYADYVTQLWKTDGTPKGTVLVKDFTIGHQYAYFDDARWGVAGNKLFLSLQVDGRQELWVSDGTNAGTRLVKNINPSGYSWPRGFLDVNGIAYFQADDGVHGAELWRSDGTAAGTYLVRDIHPGKIGSYVSPEVAAGSKLFFTADAPDTGREVYATDGTEQGTLLLKDFNPAVEGATFLGGFGTLGDLAIFGASDGHQMGLWRSDGTPEGTSRLLSYYFESPGMDPSYLIQAGNNLFFTAGSLSFSGEQIIRDLSELWATDGTPDGTRRVLDINPGLQGSFPGTYSGDPMPTLGSIVFFGATTDNQGRELWKSDGTGPGTQLLADVNPGPAAGVLSNMTISGNHLIFIGNDGTHGAELWRLPLLGFPYSGPTGSITGAVFNDANGDGIKQSQELPLAGRVVYLDEDEDGVLDADERQTTTDSDGIYILSRLIPGTYPVRQVLPKGWREKTSSKGSARYIKALANRLVATPSFGATDAAAKISGILYNDTNGNGAKDAGESGLKGWSVWLDLDKDGKPDPKELIVKTASSGRYSFSRLSAGTFRVCVSPLTKWKRTTKRAYFNVSLATNQTTSTGKDFGFIHNVLVASRSFHDPDSGGTSDSAKGGLSAWEALVETRNNGILW